MTDNDSKENIAAAQEAFIRGWDFMKLGQALDKENWNSAMMITMRMRKTADELELSDISERISRIRTLVQQKNRTAALNAMAQLTAKRVQLINKYNASGEKHDSLS